MNKLLFCAVLLLVATIPSASALAAAGVGGELFATPKSSVELVNVPFDVRIFASTNGDSVNAIEGELAYNPSDFSVEKISIENSILTSFATAPSFDGSAGLIKFSGSTGQTFSGQSGLLLTVRLRPLRVGQSSLDFNSGAMLSTTQRGSNIITSMHSSAFRIEPQQTQARAPAVAAPTKPADAPSATPSVPVSDATVTSGASATLPPTPESSNAAAVALSGMELAPVLVPFFAVLVLIAFCIAYVLHKLPR